MSQTTLPSLSAVTALRSHPRFQTALREETQGTVALYRSNRILNSLMNDRARALFTHAALYLHYIGGADGKPGLTAGAMKDICVELGLCSRGRCEAMLALMRAAGLFAAVSHPDRRLRAFAPTEKLFALHRERWGEHLKAMRHILPEGENYFAALGDPHFVKAFVIALTQTYIAGLRLITHAPELALFVERNAGIVILYSLALAGPAEGPFPAVAPVPLSINALANSFSVSRKHVLTLLRDAEAQGLLARGGSANDRITLLPPVREALEKFLATMFLFLAQCAEHGLRACDNAAAADLAAAG
jgi:hypothetical protein